MKKRVRSPNKTADEKKPRLTRLDPKLVALVGSRSLVPSGPNRPPVASTSGHKPHDQVQSAVPSGQDQPPVASTSGHKHKHKNTVDWCEGYSIVNLTHVMNTCFKVRILLIQ
jgi:hypothetical protein